MPRYDYACNACDFRIEDVQFLIAERDYPTTQPCPTCKKEGTLERVIAAPGLSDSILRGGLETRGSYKDLVRAISR